MTDTIAVCLLSGIAVWLLFLTGWMDRMRNDIKTIRLAVKLFVDGMAKAAVEVMHSPDDHLGLDAYLDKYVAGHYDMSNEDWVDFKAKCERVQKDRTLSDAERIAAGTILAAFCAKQALHKLQRLPPPLMERLSKDK
jgi:hypothetical protein